VKRTHFFVTVVVDYPLETPVGKVGQRRGSRLMMMIAVAAILAMLIQVVGDGRCCTV
jgi:hypothetical protein